MSKKPDVYMPLFIGDFVKHVARFRDGDIGSYILLIIDYWVVGPPPDDDEILATIARCDAATWAKRRRLIAPFFQIEDGVWRHGRIEEELAKAATRSRKASKASKTRHGMLGASSEHDPSNSQAGAEHSSGAAIQSHNQDSLPPTSGESARPGVVDYRLQIAQVMEAAGDAAASPAVCPGLASIHELRALLTVDPPCDWSDDILPAVTSAAAWHRGRGGPGSMRTWSAARKMAVENRDRRLAGIPKPGDSHERTRAPERQTERSRRLSRAFSASEAALERFDSDGSGDGDH